MKVAKSIPSLLVTSAVVPVASTAAPEPHADSSVLRRTANRSPEKALRDSIEARISPQVPFAGGRFAEAAVLASKEEDRDPWDPSSGNCVVEVKSQTSTEDGRPSAKCSISASPAGEAAYTEYDDWRDCAVDRWNEFEFPDAGDRRSVGRVGVQFTEEGDKDGFEGDGLHNPEIAFLDLHPQVKIQSYNYTISGKTPSGEEKDPICTYKIYDDEADDTTTTGWISYKCGVPCRDTEDDFTRAELLD